MHAVKRNRGLSLIEGLLYIGLMGVVIGGVIVSLYPIFTNTERLSQRVTEEGEVAFFLQKLSWALDSQTSVSVGSPSSLTVNTAAGSYTFAHSGENISFDDGSGAELLLASRVRIENLTFTYIAAQGGVPSAVEVEFDANGKHVGPVIHYAHY